MSTPRDSAQTKHKGRSVCRRCKDQHIRCDAGTRGIPCSHCQRVGNVGCHIAQTRRSRAMNGRFVASKAPDEAAECSERSLAVPSRRVPCMSERLPPFSIDLAALCDNRRQATYLSGMWSIYSHERFYASDNQDRHRAVPSPCGEGWYLSYVLHTTNSDPECLQPPIIQARERASPWFSQNTNSPRVTDHPRQNPGRAALSPRGFPPPQLVDELLREYFTIFQPFCPILDRAEFLGSVKDGSVSQTLLHCVLFIAATYCDVRIIHLLGYDSRIEAEDDLFNIARTAVNSEEETDPLAMLLCSYLLHYWTGSSNKTQDSLWWLAGTIRAAQGMAMHRKVHQTTVPAGRERMWRRIWWLLYIRDRQISISLGKPLIISDCDCDVDFIDGADLSGESQTTVSYVLAQANLSISVSKLLRTYFAPSSTLPISDEASIVDFIDTMFSEWDSSLPSGLQCNGFQNSQLALLLHLTSNYYRIIVYQKLQRRVQNTSTDIMIASNNVIMDAAERITYLTENAMTHLRARYFPMICVSAIFAAMTAQFTQANAPAQPPSHKNALFSSIKYKMLALKEFEECHVLAGWIRQLFLDMFNQQSHQTDTSQGQDLVAENGLRPDGNAPYRESLDIPNTATDLIHEDLLTSTDSGGMVTDMPHPMPWEHPFFSTPSSSSAWNDLLLSYQDGTWHGVSEETILGQLLPSASNQ